MALNSKNNYVNIKYMIKQRFSIVRNKYISSINLPVYLKVVVVQVEDVGIVEGHLRCTPLCHHSEEVAVVGHYYCIGASKIVAIGDGLAELVAHDDLRGDTETMLS